MSDSSSVSSKPASPRQSSTPSRAGSSMANKKGQSIEEQLQEIERKYPDVKNAKTYGNPKNGQWPDEISGLRRMKKDAIDNFDFDKSEAIQKYINLSSLDNTDRVIKSFQEWLKETILEAIGNYESNLVEIEQEINDKEIEARENANKAFENLKEKQLKEISDIETLRSISELREKNREFADVQHLKIQSKKLATNDDVQGAKMFHQQALDLQKENVKNSTKSVNDRYDKLLDQLKEKQRSELTILEESLNSSLEKIEKEKDDSKKIQQRQISVYIKKNIQRAYTDGTKQLVVKSKNNSELFSKSISKYVKDLLKEQNKTELLEVE